MQILVILHYILHQFCIRQNWWLPGCRTFAVVPARSQPPRHIQNKNKKLCPEFRGPTTSCDNYKKYLYLNVECTSLSWHAYTGCIWTDRVQRAYTNIQEIIIRIVETTMAAASRCWINAWPNLCQLWIKKKVVAAGRPNETVGGPKYWQWWVEKKKGWDRNC